MSDRPEDRRRHRRVSATIAVQLQDGEEASTQDLSEGGMGIVLSRKMERGTMLEVLIGGIGPSDPAAIKTMATVMWSAETDTGAYTAGLKFDGPSPDALERLRKFLKEQE
jgi:c-di-GMP-binding flagellar brake protein YcgR